MTRRATTDPCDMGALLTAAIAASGRTRNAVATATGIAAPSLYRALANADASPEVARKVLATLGCRIIVIPA